MTARNRTTWLALAGILALGLLLRLWNIDHGLPYVYNADEELHFVPKAVDMLSGSLNPHYFENPPALTYLLFALYKIGLGAGNRFELARIVVALIGTGVIALVYWAAWEYTQAEEPPRSSPPPSWRWRSCRSSTPSMR